MRRILTILLLTTTPALADDTTTSAMIAKQGINATIDTLEATEAAPDRDMALAGLRFLSAVEKGYQARWKSGATQPMMPFPILGTMLPENPNPEALSADFVNKLAVNMNATMEEARDAIPAEDGAVVLRLSDLWLDVNMDGIRAPEESLLELTGLSMTAEPGEQPSDEIRFDAADAHWLRAYTHLVQAVSTTILAFDPEPEIARSLELNDAIEKQMIAWSENSEDTPERPSMLAMSFGGIVDKVAIAVKTLLHQPDAKKIDEAAKHIHAMIAANHTFWQALAEETDNDREWIPNDTQQAALGFDIPKGAGDSWLQVLTDAEEVLTGDKLIPYWRFAPGYGIDLSTWLEDPQPVDIIDWIQGTGPLPYARKGETMDREGWSEFNQMFAGRAGLYMVLFN